MRRDTGRGGMLAAGMAMIALAGCGETQIDAQRAEDFGRGLLNPKPQTIDCPSGVAAEQGGTFTCRVSYADGDRGELAMRMVDDEGQLRTGGGSDLRITSIGAKHSQDVVREFVTKAGLQVRSVSCADDVRAMPGTVIDCRLSTPTEQGTIKLRVADTTGKLGYVKNSLKAE